MNAKRTLSPSRSIPGPENELKGHETFNKYDPYEKDIPHAGSQFNEGGKTVYWNCANHGDSVETALKYNDGKRRPLDAKEIETPEGKMVIVKWEAVKRD